jgi:hypothetical protein
MPNRNRLSAKFSDEGFSLGSLIDHREGLIHRYGLARLAIAPVKQGIGRSYTGRLALAMPHDLGQGRNSLGAVRLGNGLVAGRPLAA